MLIDRTLTAAEYEKLAREYYRTLPLEHFMESVPQANQRKLALESLDVLRVYLPQVQLFNELLIQYLRGGEIRRVVPDNMVRLADQDVVTKGSFNIELEPVAPFWVLEWVSSSSEGKDYGDAFDKYEKELKVPYCLLFHYEDMDLKLFRHDSRRYKRVKANTAGRLPIPELDLEVGIVGDWARFWHKGELLPLPDELLSKIDTLQSAVDQEKRRANKEKRRADQETRRAEQEAARAEQEAARAEQETARAEQEAARAEQETRRADREKALRGAAEEELARLKSDLARAQGEKPPSGEG